MTKPASNHVDLHPGLQQMDGGRVPKGVGADRLGRRQPATGHEAAGAAADDLVDPKPGQGPAGSRDEHGVIWWRRWVALLEELELPSGLGPQRAHPPFIPLAVQA